MHVRAAERPLPLVAGRKVDAPRPGWASSDAFSWQLPSDPEHPVHPVATAHGTRRADTEDGENAPKPKPTSKPTLTPTDNQAVRSQGMTSASRRLPAAFSDCRVSTLRRS